MIDPQCECPPNDPGAKPVYSETCPVHVDRTRRDLAQYVNSTRFALTWADVAHRAADGDPYPNAWKGMKR